MVKQIKLLLRCNDDSVIIMSFVLDDGYTVKRKGTDEEIRKEILKASSAWPQERLPIISWEEITDEHLIDRTFRDAWITKGNKKIEHDMVKAREIYKVKLRPIRDCELAKLDTFYLIADEKQDIVEKTRIIKEKNRLRDITKDSRIEAAKTVEELKVAIPELLDLGGK